MKRIRNRKFLKARRMQYSILLGAYRSSIQEFFQTAAELTDEAEFEARVAARLARISVERGGAYPCRNGRPALGCMRDKTTFTGPYAVHCEDCILREVRIAIEEELDADEKRKELAESQDKMAEQN